MPSINVNPSTASLIEGALDLLEGKSIGQRPVELPMWNPDGSEVKTVEEMSVLMAKGTDVTAHYVLQSKDASADLISSALEVIEEKVVRHVRTPAGAKKYGQPIGSIIVRDGASPLKHLTSIENEYDDVHSAVKGSDGKNYLVVNEGKGKWSVVSEEGGWDDIVVDGVPSQEEALTQLDGKLGGGKGKTPKASAAKPAASKPTNIVVARIAKGEDPKQADLEKLSKDELQDAYNAAADAGNEYAVNLIDNEVERRKQPAKKAAAKKPAAKPLTPRQKSSIDALTDDARKVYQDQKKQGKTHEQALKAAHDAQDAARKPTSGVRGPAAKLRAQQEASEAELAKVTTARSKARMAVRLGQSPDAFNFTVERKRRLQEEYDRYVENASTDELTALRDELERMSKAGSLNTSERATALVAMKHISEKINKGGAKPTPKGYPTDDGKVAGLKRSHHIGALQSGPDLEAIPALSPDPKKMQQVAGELDSRALKEVLDYLDNHRQKFYGTSKTREAVAAELIKRGYKVPRAEGNR